MDKVVKVKEQFREGDTIFPLMILNSLFVILMFLILSMSVSVNIAQ